MSKIESKQVAAPRSKHQRPRLKVHGAWAFGYVLEIFVMDDVAKHDSSCIIEILALTLEKDTWLFEHSVPESTSLP